MRRRTFLATLASGGLVATAGCGYAYGGGDRRATESFGGGSSGFNRSTYHATGIERIARVRTGDGFAPFSEPTELGVFDLGGEPVWRADHDAVTVAVAGDPLLETIVAIEEADTSADLVAFTAPEADDEADADRGETPEGSVAWRAVIDELGDREGGAAVPPITAGDAAAYLALDGTILAVHDGEERWRASTDIGQIGSIHVADGRTVDVDGEIDGVVVSGENAVVALDPTDGSERWRYGATEPDGPTIEIPREFVPDPQVHLHDGDRLIGLDWRDGSTNWETETVSASSTNPRAPSTTEGLVAVVGSSGLAAVDAADGTERWRMDRRVGSPVAIDRERVYWMDGSTTVATGPDGTQWRRDLDDVSGRALTAWLAGDRVGFAFDDSTIVLLQREDEEPGVLPFSTRR